MKALSIKQPWASLIAHGIKDIENRTWKTNFRGRIYIHASSKPSFNNLTLGLSHDQIDYVFLKTEFPLLTKDIFYSKSAIIGEVDIVDCVINHPSIWAERSYHSVSANSLPFGEEDEPDYIIYNWVLANAVIYDEPILNVKGKLSLWEYEQEVKKCNSCLAIELEDTLRGDTEWIKKQIQILKGDKEVSNG
ncbi:ASCH domain-containing protein [Sphingobacterium faecium]|uniref:ASCH domain-containing protein n=1 Tax=Sphingobacterium faecium TaxID=34087 RepID=UPI0021B55971|nr:ASCH domain-containing protein [Sphingobacterium faecium]UXD67768.1 ASCH domain-containing protein [Sphingobacterium faecium]